MEKVASMQAVLADKFRENCGHFWINIYFLAVFSHQCPQMCITINNLSILVRIYRIYWKRLQLNAPLYAYKTTLKIGLLTKINFFHVWF